MKPLKPLEPDQLIEWLLEGDVSLQYQTLKDLKGEIHPEIQKRISEEGWGKQFIKNRNKDGHWGHSFYQPKWTSTHYVLLDLRNLWFPQNHPEVRKSIEVLTQKNIGWDGGINPNRSNLASDVCVNGMFLNYACYFGVEEKEIRSIIDFLLGQIMKDGGFNCMSNRSGAVHSSLHSTLTTLEGLFEYLRNGYTYRKKEIEEVIRTGNEFILLHRLFRSDHTGEVINPAFIKFPFPGRWRYDILRAMDYFQFSNQEWDPRMRDAMDIIIDRRGSDRTWKLNSKYPGQVYFEMEKAGKPSRWNTLRALRILKRYSPFLDLESDF